VLVVINNQNNLWHGNMRLGRANVVEVAFGKQPNISMKQPIPVVLLFENGMSAAVPAEDFSLIIFASFLLYRPKRQVFSSVRRSQGADCWRSRAVSLFASPRVGLASDKPRRRGLLSTANYNPIEHGSRSQTVSIDRL